MLIYRSTCNPPRSNLSVMIFYSQSHCLLPWSYAKISFSNTLLISETFHLATKTSIALCWPVYLKTLNVFSLGFSTCLHTLQVIRKIFSGTISPQPQKYRARLVTVTNEPFPRPSTSSFAFPQAKKVFLFNKLKMSTVTDLVDNFKSERICCKILVSKKLGRVTLSIVRTSKTRISQTQERKTFSAKDERNSVNFGVVTKFKFRYSIVKFLLVWFNQLTGLHPPLV